MEGQRFRLLPISHFQLLSSRNDPGSVFSENRYRRRSAPQILSGARHRVSLNPSQRVSHC